jgi:hypothetical protein
MPEAFFILLVLGILALAAGILFGGVLNKVVHSRKDCPLCFESIPAAATICPKCHANL